jgi:hypothetical protein
MTTRALAATRYAALIKNSAIPRNSMAAFTPKDYRRSVATALGRITNV